MLAAEHFQSWWDALNAEFPTYKLTDDQLAAVAKGWFRELQFQTPQILTDATRDWRRKNSKRPHLNDILELCGKAHWIEKAKQKPAEWTDTNRCPCGCGGARWALVLQDRDGNDRGVFNEEAPEWLRGTPLTRDRVACESAGTDRVPFSIGQHIGNDERGVPMWRVPAEG